MKKQSINNQIFSLFLFFSLFISLPSYSQINFANVTTASKMDWWREARFGMFIHNGASTVRGKSEWGMNYDKVPVPTYLSLLSQFNPTPMDIEGWVKLAKEAGQKYIIYTTKHHDGFASFKSTDPLNVVDGTLYKKDIVDQLVVACRKHGMKFGFYYSQGQDWTHPGGAASGGYWDPTNQQGDFDTYFNNVALKQIKELCRRYPDVSVLWWDTPQNVTTARAQLIKNFTDSLPNIIHNDRMGGGLNQDFKTPELSVPDAGYPGYDWETCMTMNNHWGYYEGDYNFKSTSVLLRMLIDINSKGGNLLLNIGPDKNGVIPQGSVSALKAIGAWMSKNNESIYGTTLISNLTKTNLPWIGRVTGKTVNGVQKAFLHVFEYVPGSKLYLPITNAISKAYLLTDPTNLLVVERKTNFVNINLPVITPDSISTVVVVEYTGTITVPTGQVYNLTAKGSATINVNSATTTEKALTAVFADQLSNPITGRKIMAEVISGNDYLKMDGLTSKATDINGEATFAVKSGRFPGIASVKLSTDDGKSVTFKVNVAVNAGNCINVKVYSDATEPPVNNNVIKDSSFDLNFNNTYSALTTDLGWCSFTNFNVGEFVSTKMTETNGNHYFRCTTNIAKDDYNHALAQYTSKAIEPGKYKLTFRSKADAGGYYLKLSTKTATGVFLPTNLSESSNGITLDANRIYITPTTEWQNYSCVFDLNFTTADYIRVFFQFHNKGTYDIDDVQLIPYTPTAIN